MQLEKLKLLPLLTDDRISSTMTGLLKFRLVIEVQFNSLNNAIVIQMSPPVACSHEPLHSHQRVTPGQEH